MAEVLVGLLRLAHALAAATWIGGTLIWMIAGPDAGSVPPGQRRALREALRVGIGVFVLTGAILTVQRLGSAALPPIYVGLLAIKIALGIRMFAVARHIGGGRHPAAAGLWGAPRPEREVLGLGIVVYALAIALRSIYEVTIRS